MGQDATNATEKALPAFRLHKKARAIRTTFVEDDAKKGEEKQKKQWKRTHCASTEHPTPQGTKNIDSGQSESNRIRFGINSGSNQGQTGIGPRPDRNRTKNKLNRLNNRANSVGCTCTLTIIAKKKKEKQHGNSGACEYT